MDMSNRGEEQKSHVITLQELVKRHDQEPEIPFLWNGIKQGSFGYIYGPAKSGKTIFCENLGLSIAAGLDNFFGQSISHDGSPVLFVSLEEHWRHRAERNNKQLKRLSWDSDKQLNYVVVDNEFPRFFTATEDWETLNKAITDSSASVVFIDSLTRMVPGDIEKSARSRDASLRLRDIAYENDKTLIVIHHTPKLNDGGSLTIDSLAGSRVLAQEADFLIGINKCSNSTRYVKEVGFRYKQENDETVTTFSIDDYLWISPIAEIPENRVLKGRDGRFNSENADKVLEIAQNQSQNNDGIIQTKDCETEALDHMSRSTFYDQWNKLRKAGRLLNIGKGQYKLKD